MEIQLDSEAIQVALHKAIMDSMDVGARERMISAAIQHLITPPAPTTYDRNRKSPLQEAFDREVGMAANRIVAEHLKGNAEFEIRIKQLVGEALIKMDEQNYTQHLANAFAAALRKDS